MGTENASFLEEQKDEAGEYIFQKTGLESSRINDFLYFHESEERGSVIFRLESDEVLEEDLSQMEKGESLLGDRAHKRLSEEAIRDTVKILGKYLPKESVDSLLPRFDLEKVDEYDFSSAKIKIVVLPEKDYDFMYSTLNPSRDNRISGGFTKMTRSVRRGDISDKEVTVNMSERKLVVVREIGETVKELLRPDSKKLEASELSESEKQVIEINLKAIMVHEIIHGFDIGVGLRSPFREGITEWYAQQVIRSTSDIENSYGGRAINIGYKSESTGIAILLGAALEAGISQDTIDKALLSDDKEARKELSDFWATRYGGEAERTIVGWDFKSPKDSLDYIIGLESCQDSKIGRFLKSHEVSLW